MSENDADGFVVGRIIIERRITGDDVVDWVTTDDGQGEEIGIAEALGMLRLAEHTLLHDNEGDE